MHLVSFIIRIYYDARSSESQIHVAGCMINMDRNSLFLESLFIFPLPYPLTTRSIERLLLGS